MVDALEKYNDAKAALEEAKDELQSIKVIIKEFTWQLQSICDQDNNRAPL